jgi:hypothetical protein
VTEPIEAEHPEPEASAPSPPVPPSPSRERRAATGFGWLGVFTGVVFAVVLGSGGRTSLDGLPTIVRLIPGLAGFAALVVGWYGVSRRRPWALAALVPCLWVLITGGLLAAVVALTRSTLLVPFDAVIGFWILGASAESPASSGGRSTSTRTRLAAVGLVGLFVGGAFGPYATDLLLTRGGPLLVGRSDLDDSLVIDCGPLDGAPPEVIAVTYRWTWRRTELLPGGEDMLTVTWSDLADGGVSGYELAQTQGLPAGISEANRTIGPGEEAIVLSSDFGASQRDGGEVTIILERVIPDLPPDGLVQLSTRYVHEPSDPYDPASGGAWEVERDEGSCAW